MQPSSGRAPGRVVAACLGGPRLGGLGAVSAHTFSTSTLRVEPRYLLAISSSSWRRAAQNSRIVGVDCTICSLCSGRTCGVFDDRGFTDAAFKAAFWQHHSSFERRRAGIDDSDIGYDAPMRGLMRIAPAKFLGPPQAARASAAQSHAARTALSNPPAQHAAQMQPHGQPPVLSTRRHRCPSRADGNADHSNYARFRSARTARPSDTSICAVSELILLPLDRSIHCSTLCGVKSLRSLPHLQPLLKRVNRTV